MKNDDKVTVKDINDSTHIFFSIAFHINTAAARIASAYFSASLPLRCDEMQSIRISFALIEFNRVK